MIDFDGQMRGLLKELFASPNVVCNWIDIQDADYTFVPGQEVGCPLYCFVADSIEARRLEQPAVLLIKPDLVSWKERPAMTWRRFRLPLWATLFISKIDELAGQGIVGINRVMAAKIIREVIAHDERASHDN
jgi:hypothetical protein